MIRRRSQVDAGKFSELPALTVQTLVLACLPCRLSTARLLPTANRAIGKLCRADRRPHMTISVLAGRRNRVIPTSFARIRIGVLYRSVLAICCLIAGSLLAPSRAFADIAPQPAPSTWSATVAPTLDSTRGSFIAALSCPAAGWCTAIAQYTNGYPKPDEGYILTQTAGTWSARPLPQPPGLTDPMPLRGPRLACTRIHECVIFTNTNTAYPLDNRAYILTEHGDSWTAQPQPLAPQGQPITINGLACPEASACTAVGRSADSSQQWAPVVLEQQQDRSWSAATAPIPPGESCDGDDYGDTTCQLTALSCPAIHHCVAIGRHPHDFAGDRYGSLRVNYALIQTMSGWQAETMPIVWPDHDGNEPSVAALDCPTATPLACVGVGSSDVGNNHSGIPYAFTRAPDSAWSVKALPLPDADRNGLSKDPGGREIPGYTYMTSLSCPLITDCAAGGIYTNAPARIYGAEAVENPVVLASATSNWRALAMPSSDEPASVSCPAPGECAAIVPYAANPDGHMALSVLSDGSWTSQPAPTPPGKWTYVGSQFYTATGEPNFIDCPTVGTCTGAANYFQGQDGDHGKILLLHQHSPRPARMVAFGDSYTSGEGLVPEGSLQYDCATDLHKGMYFEDTTLPFNFGPNWTSSYCDTRTLSNAVPADLASRPTHKHENVCHRHARAYPNQLRTTFGIAPQDYIFVACSGATTRNVGLVEDPEPQYRGVSPVNVAGGKTQIDTVDPDFTRDGQPELVTIGIGGNDAGFADIIKECLKDCLNDDVFASSTLAHVNNYVFRQLRETFRGLKARFPAATILAFGYPSVIGDPDKPCALVGVGPWKVNHDELLWLKDYFLPALNSAIADAASEAGVAYVDIFNATKGHELCSDGGQRWINGVRGGDDALLGLVGNESFHPNQFGHDAIAQYFIDHYTDGSGRLLMGNPEPGPPTRTLDNSRIYLGSLNADVASSCGTSCLQPAAQCVPGCQLHLTGTGYGPNSNLRVTLHSDPVELGTLTADASGDLAGDVRVPPSTAPGVHAISLRGTAQDGSQEYATSFIEVTVPVPPGGSTSLIKPGGPSTIGLPRRVPPRVGASVSARWRLGSARTRVARMVVRHIPAGGTVVINCARKHHPVPRPCKSRSFHLSAATKRLSVTRLFRAALRVGTKITVSVTRPDWIGKRYVFTVRSHRRPAVSRLCLPAGSTIAQRQC